MSKAFIHYIFVCVGAHVLRWTSAQNPGVRALTSACDQLVGGQVILRGTFDSIPLGPVNWIRPDGITVGSCKANETCDTNSAGYVVSQSSTLNYTIVIASATSVDAGGWTFEDAINTFTFNLELLSVNPTTVDVSCGNLSGETISVQRGSAEQVTCNTDCIPGNWTLTFSLESQNGTDISVEYNVRKSLVACAIGCGMRHISTFTLRNSQEHQPGNYTLCYVLTDSERNKTQTYDECTRVVFLGTSGGVGSTTTDDWLRLAIGVTVTIGVLLVLIIICVLVACCCNCRVRLCCLKKT